MSERKLERAETGAREEVVEVDRKGAVATVYLNRPEARNALNHELVAGLRSAITDLGRDASVRVILLRGRGKSFCAGADLKEARLSSTYAEHRDWTDELNGLLAAIEVAPVPVIAAVHGHAIGAGCTLALVCDYVILSSETSLGFPELKHGLTPGMTYPRLRKLVGPRRAMSLILTGRSISAELAVTWGIASESTSFDLLDSAAQSIADQIAEYSPDAVRAIKRLSGSIDAMSPAAAKAAGTDAVIIGRLRDRGDRG